MNKQNVNELPCESLTLIRNPPADHIANDHLAFLKSLAGPTAFLQHGADPSRYRAFVTLLHGNEPSGFKAVHRWLRSGQQPVVSMLWIIASTEAALTEPVFSHRMLPDRQDLNRCFTLAQQASLTSNELTQEVRLARNILDTLEAHQPESIIDMHNTSGSNPSFGVVCYEDRQHDALITLFSHRLVVTDLKLGALFEITESHYPTVTVEVGGRLDPASDDIAYEGLCRYALMEDIMNRPLNVELDIYYHPIRVELNKDLSIAYSDYPIENVDLTLDVSIEQYNFSLTQPGTVIGWVSKECINANTPIFNTLEKGSETHIGHPLFQIRGNALTVVKPCKFFMITTNAYIAQNDCLCYAVLSR